MSESLTPEILQQAMNQVVNLHHDEICRRNMIYCHPIDAPCIKTIFGNRLPPAVENRVLKMWDECKRKWIMGGKRGIAKWGLKPLIEQYKAKLEVLGVQPGR